MLHTNSEDRKNSLFVQLLTCIKCTRLPVFGGTTAICSRNTPFLSANTPCHAGNTLTCAKNRPIHTRNMPICTGYMPIRAEYTLLHTGNFLFQCWPEVSVGNIHNYTTTNGSSWNCTGHKVEPFLSFSTTVQRIYSGHRNSHLSPWSPSTRKQVHV